MTQKIVVAGFIVRDGKVLLAKRPSTKKIAPDKYHLPGGHVEFGEDLKNALKRELHEELGIDVQVDEPFFSFTYNDDDTHTIGLVCEAGICGSIDVVLNTDTDHIAWVDEGDLSKYLRADDHNFRAAQIGFNRIRGTSSQ